MTPNTVILQLNDESMVKLHARIYQEKLQELLSEKVYLKDMIKQYHEKIKGIEGQEYNLKNLLRQLESNHKPDIIPSSEPDEPISLGQVMDANYNPEWSLFRKIVYVMKETGQKRLFGTREMCELLKMYEPRIIKAHGSLDRLQKNIGSTLLQKIAKQDTFYREQMPSSDGVKQIRYGYGLLEWDNDDKSTTDVEW